MPPDESPPADVVEPLPARQGGVSRSDVLLRRVTSGAVLAGGASRRMGTDKRELEIGGAPLLRRAVDATRAVCADVVVVTAPGRPVPDDLTAGVPVVEDLRPDAGPLAGIEAALHHARHELVLVLAGDHPGAAPAVLRSLVRTLAATESADAVALGTARGPQPLVAAYRRRSRQVVSNLLDAGERRATTLPDHLTVVTVAESTWRDADPRGRTAFDVDTPDDLLEWDATR